MELQELAQAVERGKVKQVKLLTNQALEEGYDVQDILNEGMIAAMAVVGENFRLNKIFVPEMLVAARAMAAGTAILEPLLIQSGIKSIGTVVIGTVKGDLHDIGKNLCAMMLKGTGATVYDLGVDVPDATFVQKAEELHADIVVLSALLTTTMPAIGEVIQEFEKSGVRSKYHIMIGGAPVTQQFADEVGANAYTANASECATVAKSYLESKAS